MTDWRQRKIRKQHERHKSRNTARIEELVIESSNAAVQEEIVMIARYYTGFTHRTMEGSCWYEFSAYVAAVSIAGRLSVIFKVGKFVVGDEQCHLIIFDLWLVLVIAKTVGERPLVCLKLRKSIQFMRHPRRKFLSHLVKQQQRCESQRDENKVLLR